MNGIIRVFPRRTSYTPVDDYAFIGLPPMNLPAHREVRVSCVFTWDKALAEELAYQWEGRTDKPVTLGGPAFGSPAGEHTPGLYIKPNIIFTTRGCNNGCGWCSVPRVEGRLWELPVVAGNVIQDNNFLQASRRHKEKVFAMLRTQRGICFRGGLEAGLVDDHFIDGIRDLRIAELWLACDTNAALPVFKRAVAKLSKAGYNREKIRCYVLVGDDMAANETRLLEVYHAGAMPFAQLYQPFENEKLAYSDEWKAFHRLWSRPAIIRARVRQLTQSGDSHT